MKLDFLEKKLLVPHMWTTHHQPSNNLLKASGRKKHPVVEAAKCWNYIPCLRLRTLETIPSSAAHKCFGQKKGVPLGVENRCHRFPECTIVLDVSGLLLRTILDMTDIFNSVIVILASTFLKTRGRTLIFYLVHSFSFFSFTYDCSFLRIRHVSFFKCFSLHLF